MRKILKTFSAILAAISLLSLPALAQAQEITLRLEPGVAVPLTAPQSQRFNVGGALAVKPELTLGHYVGIGPSGSVITFPSKIDGIDGPTAWGLGGFLRVKRPHDELNTGRGVTAISPWVDADLMAIETGPLHRLGWAVAAGASVPTSDARNLWIGPFVRYEGVHEDSSQVGINTNDAKTLIIGVSFELGGSAKKKDCPPPEPQVQPPPVVHQDVEIELHEVVQFAWDSPVLDKTARGLLTEVVTKLDEAKDFRTIKIEGHASSDGQVEHNDVLSQKRAQSVVNFLVAHGIPRDKLTAVGFGSRVPVAPNTTHAGRVLNRRAQFVVKFVIVKEGK
jgi:outer membrane protein OmpA-like peptidoglycan-associated protein